MEKKTTVIEHKNGKKITRRIPKSMMWKYTGGYNNFLVSIGKDPEVFDWDKYNVSVESVE